MEASSLQLRPRIGYRCAAAPDLLWRSRPIPCRPLFGSLAPRRLRISMRLESNSTGRAGLGADTAIKYSDDTSGHSMEVSYPSDQPTEEKLGTDGSVNIPVQQKGSAKIHDFCFGIPFGGFVFAGGFIGFLLSRNLSILSSGFLFGGAILALSTCSLKVWRQGKSSLPFILGQAAIATVLAVKNFQMYSLTKKLFPSGFIAVFSAAMLCFYSYVMISGGNPPPKRLKATATSPS